MAEVLTPGRRVYPEADGRTFSALEPGDYIYFQDVGRILYWPPGCPVGPWGGHELKRIEVHPDKTITVSPSILCTYSKIKSGMLGQWHGYLEKGIWRQDG